MSRVSRLAWRAGEREVCSWGLHRFGSCTPPPHTPQPATTTSRTRCKRINRQSAYTPIDLRQSHKAHGPHTKLPQVYQTIQGCTAGFTPQRCPDQAEYGRRSCESLSGNHRRTAPHPPPAPHCIQPVAVNVVESRSRLFQPVLCPVPPPPLSMSTTNSRRIVPTIPEYSHKMCPGYM